MRAMLLTAIAAVILSPPALCERAEAMTFGGTLAQRAAADTAFVRQAVVVCGSNGCGRVHTSRVSPHRPRP